MAATMTTVVKGTEEGGNFFSRMAWYWQMGVLLLLSGLLIFAVDYLLYSDTRADTVKIQDKVQQLKAKNAQGSIIRQNLAATEETLKGKREEIDRLRDLLPDQVEISRVYDNIKDFLREQKLELKRFVHLKAANSDFYTAQPIQIEVTGSYDALGQFFSRLGFFSRIVSVTDVEIKTAEDNAQEMGRSINGAFVVTAYYIAPENLEKLTMKKAAAPPPVPGAPAAPAK
ncbi:MAG TPA: type 4a pilus biogenesis protein PilO [Blastocatellia bacterium]|jgi:type IV pilus assembly protein PilO|nr:type 4a pilus biogenesis protein PilO [Blastocatellia bacterium]